jgi:hypothetical protein
LLTYLVAHALTIDANGFPNPFVVTNIIVGGQSLQQRFQYHFYDVNGVPLGAVALTNTASGFAVFSWSNNGTWFNQTSPAFYWESGTNLYWLLYAGTFQYGLERGGVSWFQAGLLATPWISDIASVELVNTPSFAASIVSVQPVEDVLENVYACYNCSVVPSPTCSPISWPPQQQSFSNRPVNDSNLWFLQLMPSPSGQCPYYFTFSFGSVDIGVNITMGQNYTLEVTILGNAYQPVQLVYSVSQPSQFKNIWDTTFFVEWGVCIPFLE